MNILLQIAAQTGSSGTNRLVKQRIITPGKKKRLILITLIPCSGGILIGTDNIPGKDVFIESRMLY
jgi:hypothetical protein